MQKENNFVQVEPQQSAQEIKPMTSLMLSSKSGSDLHSVKHNMQILSIVLTQHMFALPCQG